MTVSVISLGCPKNLVDSEHMLGILGRAGFRLTAVPEASDVIVINTCGFLQSAVAESERVIRRCLKLKQTAAARKVIVAGCLVQRLSRRLRQTFPDVDAFVGIDGIRDLPGVIAHSRGGAEPGLPRALCSALTPRLVSTPRHYAYLRIADGCDNHCSYCLIPGIRGRFRSRRSEDIRQEAGLLTRCGAKELILIAQDTTLYGQDRYGRKTLASLLRELGGTTGIEWLRLLYTHPAHYTPELIDELALNSKVVKYVDLPLQHINDRILARMNRRYRRADVESLLARLTAIPGMSIRTTFITGFPGETEVEFHELSDFVAQGRFTHVGCFPYSPEPGTKAYRMARQLVPGIRENRARDIMRVQRRVSLAHNRAHVGQVLEVRIDAAGKDGYLGRTSSDAPEIDNVVHVRGKGLPVGALVDARVTRAGAYDLYGTVV
jgi:ribosomal protein S12 methylthiotransferase